MARKKQTVYSKKQMIDALKMGGIEYSKKYKTSMSTHQRFKLSLLQDYEVFKSLGVPVEEVPYTTFATKIIECLNNLKEGKSTVFEEAPKKVKKNKNEESSSEPKRRGRPKGSKSKSDVRILRKLENVEEIKIEEKKPEIVEIEEVQEVQEINKDEDMGYVEVQKELNLFDVLRESNLSFFAEFLENVTNLDDLVNLGVDNYFSKIRAINEKITAVINDLYHIVEFEDIVDVEKKIEIYDSLKSTLIQRRKYKDEDVFLKENKSLFISFCTVFKRAKMFNEKKDNRCYTFRQLGQEVGLTGLSKGKDPETLKVEERMIELERVRIKKDREDGRRQGNNIPIDKIEKNWKELFHNELDTYTRTELYKEASNIYKEKGYLNNFNMLKEYIIEMEIMPELLYNKRYFLRKD